MVSQNWWPMVSQNCFIILGSNFLCGLLWSRLNSPSPHSPISDSTKTAKAWKREPDMTLQNLTELVDNWQMTATLFTLCEAKMRRARLCLKWMVQLLLSKEVALQSTHSIELIQWDQNACICVSRQKWQVALTFRYSDSECVRQSYWKLPLVRTLSWSTGLTLYGLSS